MTTFLAILIYLVGNIIAFLLITYDTYRECGYVDGESVIFALALSIFSWFSVLTTLSWMFFIYAGKFAIPSKIAKQLNKLFSKKNEHKENRIQ